MLEIRWSTIYVKIVSNPVQIWYFLLMFYERKFEIFQASDLFMNLQAGNIEITNIIVLFEHEVLPVNLD